MPISATRGHTLIELLVTFAVLGILISAAQPLFTGLIETRRLGGAAEAVRSHLNFARSEAIKQMVPTVVTYAADGSSQWRIGTRGDAGCNTALTDPLHADACAIAVGADRVLTVLGSDDFPGITMTVNRPATRFNHVRGTALGTNVSIRLRSPQDKEIRVIVSNVGRIRLCSPQGDAKVPGYTNC